MSLDPRAHLAERTDHQTQELARTPTGTLPQTRASANTSHGAIHAREAPSVTTRTVPGPHEVHMYRVEHEPAQEHTTKRPDHEPDPSQLQSRAYERPLNIALRTPPDGSPPAMP
ncbi:hypothetical protein BD779DRAFT_1677578 [Infundibulicybe gibba]|nr:hypothetical protein BD779DRAFT_1677578 [Infundibulicybe gibba]